MKIGDRVIHNHPPYNRIGVIIEIDKRWQNLRYSHLVKWDSEEFPFWYGKEDLAIKKEKL